MDKASWEIRSRVSGKLCMLLSVEGTSCDDMFVPSHEVGGAAFLCCVPGGWEHKHSFVSAAKLALTMCS